MTLPLTADAALKKKKDTTARFVNDSKEDFLDVKVLDRECHVRIIAREPIYDRDLLLSVQISVSDGSICRDFAMFGASSTSF
jgi:hypothetical protein